MDTISLIGGLLYQWDTGRKVKIESPSCINVDEVHFTNDMQDALVVEPKSADNVYYAEIPNILLQEKRNIKVYVVMHTENGERTVCSRGLTVNSRQKPADYIYTETEVKSYKKLDQRIKALEETAVLTAPQSATVGQVISVKAVDESGKPTEWECVDMVSGGNEWKKIATIELTEAVSTIDITHDVNGTPLEELGYNEIVGMAVIEGVEGNSALWAKMGIVYRMHQNPTMNDITEKTAISSVSGGMISSGRKRLNFIIKVIGNRVFFTDNDINTLKSNDTGWLEYFIGSNQYMNLLSIKFCGHVATDVFGIGSEFEVWGR